MEKHQKIFVAGAGGLVGSAVVRALRRKGFENLILPDRKTLNLLDQQQVAKFFADVKPDIVFLCAGRIGGVYANDNYRAEFLYENLQIDTNVIHNAYLAEVKKLVYFGSSTMYPKLCPQPMQESALMTGALDHTSEALGISKLAGMKMCQYYNVQYGTDFVTIVPSNLYGPKQNYEPLNAMVIPSLIRKFHEAKQAQKSEVEVWGSGRGVRDFLFSDSCADAALFVANNYTGSAPLNVGSGEDMTIREVAELIQEVVGFEGQLVFDKSKIDGTLVKLLDVSKITELGWKYDVPLAQGIKICYQDFLKHPPRVL